MIHFRASAVGNCTRQLVLTNLNPSLREVDEARRPFLDAGHYLQQQVEDYLVDQGSAPKLDVSLREMELTTMRDEQDGWDLTGHVDGVFMDDSLLEVKAIKDASYKKLEKTLDWRTQYGHYAYQATAYQYMAASPGTHFVYYNRNTSEMMGSCVVDHPAYTFRGDMYLPYDEGVWLGIEAKLSDAANRIDELAPPDDCNAEGWCFFCGQMGSEMPGRFKKSMGLLPDDDEYHEVTELLGNIERQQLGMIELFNTFKVNEIVLLHPEKKETLVRRDFE